jgi:hypothetical protein
LSRSSLICSAKTRASSARRCQYPRSLSCGAAELAQASADHSEIDPSIEDFIAPSTPGRDGNRWRSPDRDEHPDGDARERHIVAPRN